MHFQQLSMSFHERYTSGRVISRQTSDIEAIEQMFTGGIVTLVTSVLLIVGIGIAMLLLDLKLAIAVLASFPILWLLTRWFRNHSERAYRATRDAIALVIVHFVESLGGIQAVHAFRREPRNQEIFDHLDDRYRDANMWSQRLAAAYGPGVQFVGRITTAIVVFYGGWLAIDGQVSVGVLAAFLLYLRRFFEPMQELSQFYNLFQAVGRGSREALGRARGAAERARARVARAAGGRARRGRIRRRRLRVPGARRCSPISTSTSPRARPLRWSAPPAQARRPSRGSPRASGTRRRATCGSTTSTCACSARLICAAR